MNAGFLLLVVGVFKERFYMNNWLVYRAYFDGSKDCYIGVTTNLKSRIGHHSRRPSDGMKRLIKDSGGFDNVKFEVLICCRTKQKALELERLLRPVSGMEYNTLQGGYRKGVSLPESTRMKLRDAVMGEKNGRWLGGITRDWNKYHRDYRARKKNEK